MMDIVLKIWEIMTNRWTLLLLIMVVLGKFCHTKQYRDIFGEIRWNMKTTKDFDIYYSDTGLRTGDMFVIPQIIVMYKERVVGILNIDGLYLNNHANVSENEKKNKINFKFKRLVKVEKFNEFKREFELIIKQQCDLNQDIDKKSCKIMYECVALCNYQPYLSNTARKRNLLFSSNLISILTEEEAKKRCCKFSYDVRSYDNRTTLLQDEQFMNNIERFMDCIKNI